MAFQTNNNKPSAGHRMWMLVSDDERMANPELFLGRLPPKSMVLLRSKNQANLYQLAVRVIPLARALGHRVLLAGPARLALRAGADGVHLSEAILKRGSIKDLASGPLPQGFILSASAHGEAALRRAKSAGVDFAVLGPALPTQSHAGAKTLGVLRFCKLVGHSPVVVVAIGGMNKITSKRVGGAGAKLVGFAAIEMFAGKN